jgi:simple sugar transport system permease protein
MPHVLHVVLAILAAIAGGAFWAGIAGVLRAFTGANEVITTIMLNYTILWIGVYLFGLGGPLQSPTQQDVPVSSDVVPGARLHVFWGDPELQGLHIGIFIALAAAVFFGVFIRRSARGYEARAVGLNPEAARYGGIRVGPTYVWVLALCGLFAGLAGAIDILGWQYRLATNDIQVGQIGFIGIAVALLGRNTALGTCVAALLFGALLQGTSTRNLDPSVFDPALAQNLTYIIQGLVILLVTADAIIIWLVARRRRPATAAEAGT